ncbi:DUF6056 family protein [Xenorhabdus szentirmaii]|uniref:DUF6056 family protein n=1 Tax=Xenorhabdus szentirmaii TaxID=290112 RepID=UPI0019C92636|nr:DUF6056 family protein [Xenorhabdus sp. 38]MBD2781242.1 hypothetical protein [Xenorhabdus sp. 38]
MINKYKISIIACLGFIFFTTIVFILNYFNPLQSDDYGYYLIGLDLNKHIHHYMTWSGRVIADFISPVLLSIKSKILLSITQTLCVIALLFFISSKKSISKSELIFTISFLSYLFFLSHPNFGQANLWVVGSANYLWTSVLYIYITREIINYLNGQKINNITYLVSLLAGCTNENASLALIGIILAALLFIFFQNKVIDKKLLTILLFTVLGSAILLSSPGNESRLMAPAFSEWRSLSLIDKIDLHLLDRMPGTIKSSKLVYFLSFIFILLLITNKETKSLIIKGRPSNTAIAITLFFVAIGCSVVMVFSPAFPNRAKTPAFIFCLMSVSYSLSALYKIFTYRKALILSYSIIFVAFVFESFPVISAYHSIHNQNTIRISAIEKSTVQDNETLIPEFYFKFLPSSTYIFDRWNNFEAMSKFYNRNNIESYEVTFDYSVINNDNYKIHGPSDMSTKGGLKEIYLYSEKYTLNTVIIFEITHQERLFKNDNQRVFLHIYDAIGNTHDFYFEPNYSYINNRIFLYASLSNIPYWFIDRVEFGMFNNNSPSTRYSQIKFEI